MKIIVKDTELNDIFLESIIEQDNGLCFNKVINENLTNDDKSEMRNLIKNEVSKFLDFNRSDKLEKRVKDIVIGMLKTDKKTQDEVVDISRNVLVQLYKTLWTRRGFWANNLSNKGS